MKDRGDRFRTIVCTVFALASFAANSVFCRLALGEGSIDAATFSSIRLGSGAAVLMLMVAGLKRRSSSGPQNSWISAAMLFLYAIPFSFAYLYLSTGTGALILFGSVQATMILAAIASGERPYLSEWAGLILALIGLVYLVSPGLTAPSLKGSALMTVAGISWGVYSLRGRRAGNPLTDTARNFLYAVPPALAVSFLMFRGIHVSGEGVVFAAASGAVASGLGYVVWYAALRGLTATRAATVQLSVPVLAAAGGVIFLAEDVSMRLILSGVMILGGVGLAVGGRTQGVRERAIK